MYLRGFLLLSVAESVFAFPVGLSFLWFVKLLSLRLLFLFQEFFDFESIELKITDFIEM